MSVYVFCESVGQRFSPPGKVLQPNVPFFSRSSLSDPNDPQPRFLPRVSYSHYVACLQLSTNAFQ